ncbi:hypothetical protein HDE_11810 [Halotydeus destructor]|nr:hypothetical protein HDE_11810 [Halotydeus destructor]
MTPLSRLPTPSPRCPLSSTKRILPSLSKKESDQLSSSSQAPVVAEFESSSAEEPKVEYSDVHSVYVKPPTDFKPVIYANRRVDGVRAYGRRSSFLPSLVPPPRPYPYPFPRGVSSWTLGGTRGVQRGSWWESMATDEALGLPVYEASSRPRSAPVRPLKRKVSKGRSGPRRWLTAPSRRQLTRVRYGPRIFYSKRVLSSPAYRRKAVSKVKPSSRKTTKAGTKSSAADSGLRTKLPVGLTSFMFGGVRDLTARHWNMPGLAAAIDKVQEPKDNDVDPMMMSGDDVDTFEPSKFPPAFSFAGEVDQSQDASKPTKPTSTNVVFDDELENNTINSDH